MPNSSLANAKTAHVRALHGLAQSSIEHCVEQSKMPPYELTSEKGNNMNSMSFLISTVFDLYIMVVLQEIYQVNQIARVGVVEANSPPVSIDGDKGSIGKHLDVVTLF